MRCRPRMLPVFGCGCRSEHATNALTRLLSPRRSHPFCPPAALSAVTEIFPVTRFRKAPPQTVIPDPRLPERTPPDHLNPAHYKPLTGPLATRLGTARPVMKLVHSNAMSSSQLKARSPCPQPQSGMVARVHADWSCVYRTERRRSTRERCASSNRSRPEQTPQSARLNAASWKRSISTGARCSSSVLMPT